MTQIKKLSFPEIVKKSFKNKKKIFFIEKRTAVEKIYGQILFTKKGIFSFEINEF